MKKVSMFLLMTALLALASTRISLVSAQAGSAAGADALHASDAAFRDGLFLGRLDAATGAPQHLSVGRWASESDRALFRSGYEAGYRQASTAR